MNCYYSIFISEAGYKWLIKCSDNYLKEISFIDDKTNKLSVSGMQENELSKKVKEELKEYFLGKRKNFDIPIELTGTEFQRKVWNEAKKVPYGSLETYLGIATSIKSPKASRAVGMALNKNPIAIIIPCHRIIGSNGKLTGYASGLNIKQYLIDLEKVNQ